VVDRLRPNVDALDLFDVIEAGYGANLDAGKGPTTYG
jgi:hypothetical protein